MSFRNDIINLAEKWATPDSGYKPSAAELISFFTDAKTQQAPSQSEAQRSLDTLSSGCYIGDQQKHWCGIFACSVAANAGLSTLSWDLMHGQIQGAEIRKIWGNSGIQPGDIAVVAAYNHHFIITNRNQSHSTWPARPDEIVELVNTVEGNTSGQLIKANTRRLDQIVAYYRILR
jgi:hypothetical protein